MYSIYLTSLLVSLVTVSCRNSGESDLSEVVGRSEGETVKRRIDSAFTVQRSGPKTAGDVFQSEGLASAEFKIYERYTVYHEEERDYLDYEYKGTKERATGTERAWQGYFEFDKPQRDKPELLAKAVLGIGDSRAEAIVNFTHDGAPLSRRPRSWE